MLNRLPRQLPDWVPAMAWFLAAIAAGGLWTFPAASNWLGLALTAAVTAILVLAAAFLQAWHSRSHGRPPVRGDAEHLLRLVWDYPLRGREQRSWAVKESAVLLGKMATAQEHPGLGIAIITTELASLAFGDAADTRIDSLVAWAVEQSEVGPPFRLLAPVRDPIGYATIEVKPDVRHTFAFGIVLLRTGREQARTAEFVRLALQSQEENGGWLPADPKADSGVFVTLYGAELLCLAPQNPDLPREVLRDVARARTRALEWLIRSREPDGLWSTGVFRDRPWDCAVATAWVLHRMLPPPRKLSDQWSHCADVAVVQLIGLVEKRETWLDVSEALRFRIEARVAASIRRATSSGLWPISTSGLATRYTSAWAVRARTSLRRLDEMEVDLGTAAFALWGLADPGQLARLGRSILAEEGL